MFLNYLFCIKNSCLMDSVDETGSQKFESIIQTDIISSGDGIIHSSLGDIRIIARNARLIYCNWIDPDCHAKEKHYEKIAGYIPSSHEDEIIIEKTAIQLAEYFEGKRLKFDIPIEFYGTEFQKKVWNSLREIPYGATLSYGSLAKMIDNKGAVRALGRACGANPVAIILPCHRVVAAGGKPGGYTGALWRKLQLISLESTEKTIDNVD